MITTKDASESYVSVLFIRINIKAMGWCVFAPYVRANYTGLLLIADGRHGDWLYQRTK